MLYAGLTDQTRNIGSLQGVNRGNFAIVSRLIQEDAHTLQTVNIAFDEEEHRKWLHGYLFVNPTHILV